MKNGNFDFIGADLCGYKDMRVKEFLPLPPNVTVMVVDTDSEDNVVMRDCVGTSGCYYMAVVEEKKGKVIYPYLLGVNGGLDLRASFVPVRF